MQSILKNGILSTNVKEGQTVIRYLSYKSHSGIFVEYRLARDKTDGKRPVSSSCYRCWLELDRKQQRRREKVTFKKYLGVKVVWYVKVVREKDKSWYLGWPNVKCGGQCLRWRTLEEKSIYQVEKSSTVRFVWCSCKASRCKCWEGNWMYIAQQFRRENLLGDINLG